MRKCFNLEDNELIYVTNDKKYYTYHKDSDSFEELTKDSVINTGITAYELNKQMISQQSDLTEEQIQESKEKIIEFITNTKNQYYMLLSNELHYYTLFDVNNKEKCAHEVIACLQDIAPLRACEYDDNGYMELWNSNYMFAFFPYDKGVIKCN